MWKSFVAALLAATLAASVPTFALLSDKATPKLPGAKKPETTAQPEKPASPGAFTGSTPLAQYLFDQFASNPSTLSVPVTLFSSGDTDARFEELGDAAIEAYIQNGLTDYVVDFKYNYTTGDADIFMNIIYNNQDAQSRQARARALENKAAEIVAARIQPGMTDRQKAETLSNYVAQNVRYDFNGFKAYQAGQNVYELQTAYSCLVEGAGICQGFARAYKLLCDTAGIPCVVIFGTTKQFGTTHAWCRVQLDGKWETVDTSNPQLAINHVGSFCIPADVVQATLQPDGGKTLTDAYAGHYLS